MRELFDIPRDVAYFNCAYVSPLMKSVRAAIEAGLQSEIHPWVITPDDFFDPPDRLRRGFARMIGASPADIALVPSASYGIATAAANITLKRGQSILLLEDEYPSNVYTWKRLADEQGAKVRFVARPTDADWTSAILEALDANVALASLAHNHWMDGALVDLERIGAALRNQNAKLVVDASQSLGAMPFDVTRIQPDFMVTSGYKWMHCPYSISFLYAAPQYHEGRPIEENPMNRQDSRAFAKLADYADAYDPGAVRYDVGERANFTLLPGAIAAVEQLLEWTPEWIQSELRAKTTRVAGIGQELGLKVLPEDRRAGHFLGLVFPGGVPDGTAARLAAEKIFVSVRGRSVRVTPHLYNDDEDLERLIAALKSL